MRRIVVVIGLSITGALSVPATGAAQSAQTEAVGAWAAPNYRPSISGDGRVIAFRSFFVAPPAIGYCHRRTGTCGDASLDSSGVGADAASYNPAVSANGRYVAFDTAAALTAGDGNGASDVFVTDLKTGRAAIASVSSSGVQGNGASYRPTISADGSVVAFTSHARNLTGSPPRGDRNVFLHDMNTGATVQVNVDARGAPAADRADFASISADGRSVAFEARQLHATSGSGARANPQVFVRSLEIGDTSLVSKSDGRQAGMGPSVHPAISGDGRFVAFQSAASNLVPSDTNHCSDVFVRDRRRRTTARVSVRPSGGQANGPSEDPAISNHGGFVAFHSTASNLVPSSTGSPVGIYLRIRRGELTTLRADVSDDGAAANGGSFSPAISADGRFVAFTSVASNLSPDATDGESNVFVRGPLRTLPLGR
jgi:Tol biopolymer transport system component